MLFGGTDKLDFDDYYMLMFKYINPIFDFYSKKAEESIGEYFEKGLSVIIGIFAIFVIYLLVCLTLALCVMMDALKKQVFRSRILLKIIPEQELNEIFTAYAK
jgi:hypothetical protein